MRFTPTAIDGAFLVDIEPHTDDRGLFARTFCPEEFAAAGISFVPVQMNLSRNDHAFTLRGMHYQPAPFAEAKLVRVTRGRAFDVAIDLRPGSPSYRAYAATELTADNARALYVPEGCAHGFLTLEPDTDVFYLMSRLFVPGHGQGVRFDDPAFAIAWPATPRHIAERDRTYADYSLSQP